MSRREDRERAKERHEGLLQAEAERLAWKAASELRAPRRDRAIVGYVPNGEAGIVRRVSEGVSSWTPPMCRKGSKLPDLDAFKAISRIIRREERAQRRCWRHEDCREDHAIGAACYALRRGWPWASSAVCQGECCVGPVRPRGAWWVVPAGTHIEDLGDGVLRYTGEQPGYVTLPTVPYANFEVGQAVVWGADGNMYPARPEPRDEEARRRMHQRFFSASAPDPVRNRGRR